MLLTITQHFTKQGYARFNIEVDGTMTHMMNYHSLEWHVLNKLGLSMDQFNLVLAELDACNKAILELVPVQAAS